MRNYINNKQLYAVMKEWKEDCQKATDEGRELPRIPEYIGESVLLIAQKLATKFNFSGYTYKEEMISDGVENCILYIHNFNPEKSNNPFGYFTTVIYNAFRRRIEKEKRQTYLKHKNYVKHVMGEVLSKPYMTDTIKSDDVSLDVIDKYEKSMDDKKRLTKQKKDDKLKQQNTVSKFLVSNGDGND